MSATIEQAGPEVFHPGEVAVQTRAGVREKVARWASRAVRHELIPQHRDFFAQLPFVVLATRDGHGRPWASLLSGAPGFAHSPDPGHLNVAASLLDGDASNGHLVAGSRAGMLGIELHSRRRNRLNGRIESIDAEGFSLAVDQSFGNCPQHISPRRWRTVELASGEAGVSRSDRLDIRAKNQIAGADTLFLATGYDDPQAVDRSRGLDASHRGGPAGFVELSGDRRLVLPDYAGNNFFNTLGNLTMDPRIGLLFIDFERGGLLQISGQAAVDWDVDDAARAAGVQRRVVVDIEALVRLDNVLALRWNKAD